jgi:hypothetical protein
MSIALLAPVPEEHLLSGLDTLRREGLVAFGSKSWELFNKLDSFLAGQDCDVLIYASDSSRPINPPTATWAARYLRTSLAINGAHKDGMKYRPESTAKYSMDNKGNWVLFWEVDELRRLPTGIKIGELRGYDKPHQYLRDFFPHGPTLIQGANFFD